MQAGTLTREVEWASPAGRAVRVRSTRLVSLTQRAIAAICYEVEVLDAPALLVLQSELVANEALPARDEADPRVEAALTDPLQSEQFRSDEAGATLIHQTRKSGLRVAAAMDHEVHGPDGTKVTSEATEDIGRTTVITRLQPGQTLRIVKYLAYGWSSRRSQPALHDQVRAALAAARYTGWDGPARPSSASTSTSSGPPRTSRSTATRSCSRRSGWPCSTCCRPGPGPSGGPSGPRG